jgi:intracellular septation protein A
MSAFVAISQDLRIRAAGTWHTDDMIDVDAPKPMSNKDLKGLVKTMLAREGGIMGIVVAIAPTVMFFVVNALSSLQPALIAAVATAVAAMGVQLIRRQSLRQAIVGFVIAGASASVAAFTGQAKGFFLITTVAGGMFSAVLFVTVLIGRPLAGGVLNRIVGGRSDWRQNRRRVRVYSLITLTWGVQHTILFVLHVWFYLANLTAALAVMAVTGPPLIVVTLAASALVARRAVGREPILAN